MTPSKWILGSIIGFLLWPRKGEAAPPSPTPKRTYVVLPGDTLTSIAIKLRVCPKPSSNTKTAWQPCLDAAERIKAANPGLITDVNRIKPGWVLTLP